jgi:hypothetical protein
VRPPLDRIGDLGELLRTEGGEAAFKALRAAETTGWPLGNAVFIADLERRLGRKLARGRPAGSCVQAGAGPRAGSPYSSFFLSPARNRCWAMVSPIRIRIPLMLSGLPPRGCRAWPW